MRFKSATVPAAVMPDRFNDHGFEENLPLFKSFKMDRMGRLLKPGQVRRPARQDPMFKAFGKKSTESSIDSFS
jgi:hypothetical protein